MCVEMLSIEAQPVYYIDWHGELFEYNCLTPLLFDLAPTPSGFRFWILALVSFRWTLTSRGI